MLDPQNSREKKFQINEIPTRKNMDPRNTQKKRSWTHEMPIRKNSEPTKAWLHNDTRTTMTRDQRNLAQSLHAQ